MRTFLRNERSVPIVGVVAVAGAVGAAAVAVAAGMESQRAAARRERPVARGASLGAGRGHRRPQGASGPARRPVTLPAELPDGAAKQRNALPTAAAAVVAASRDSDDGNDCGCRTRFPPRCEPSFAHADDLPLSMALKATPTIVLSCRVCWSGRA